MVNFLKRSELKHKEGLRNTCLHFLINLVFTVRYCQLDIKWNIKVNDYSPFHIKLIPLVLWLEIFIGNQMVLEV